LLSVSYYESEANYAMHVNCYLNENDLYIFLEKSERPQCILKTLNFKLKSVGDIAVTAR